MGRLLQRFTRSGRETGEPGRLKDAAMTVISRMFAADLRSLAVLRIVIGTLLLFDLASRATSLRLMYTDEGVLPRDVVLNDLSPWSWSLGFMSGSVQFQQVYFLVTAAAAICLILGYRTRLTTVVVWILLSSLHVRNPVVLSGGDLLLRLLLFWGMFLPLGAVWSLDAWRRRPAVPMSMRFLSLGSIALFLQIAFMYWFTAALKTGPEWREDGSALFFVLRRPLYTTPVGEWLSQFTGLLQVLSFGTMVVEIVGPILLFSPIWSARVRMLGIASLMGLHIGIMLTMSIGMFPWISSTCMLVFLPTAFWDTVEPRVREMVKGRSAALDGFRGAFERSTRGVARDLQARFHMKADAGLLLSAHLGEAGTGSGERATPPLVVGTTGQPAGAEDDGGENRAEPGPEPPMLRTSRLLNVLAACLLLFVFAWNMTTVSAFTLPDPARQVAYSLNIQQNWVMFAPSPPRFNTRYVMRGTLRNGQEVEMLLPLLEGDVGTIVPFTWDIPPDLDTGYYPDMRWRLYLARLGSATREQRFAFANYACRTWNGHHDGELEVVSMVYVYVVEDILPDGTRSGERTSGFGPYTCT